MSGSHLMPDTEREMERELLFNRGQRIARSIGFATILTQNDMSESLTPTELQEKIEEVKKKLDNNIDLMQRWMQEVQKFYSEE
jgi:membrane protein insertase Oxa1/YidC/SpoIIIJ